MHTLIEKLWKAEFSVGSMQRPLAVCRLASSSQWRTDMARRLTMATVCGHEEIHARGTKKVRSRQCWEPLLGDNQWRHRRVTRYNACCSEQQWVCLCVRMFVRVWISNSATISFNSPINLITNPNSIYIRLNLDRMTNIYTHTLVYIPNYLR
jgi:hypothetical protein